MRLTMPRGDRATFELAITDGAATPAPLDLGGRSLYFTAKRRAYEPDDEAVIAKSSPSGGINVTDAPGGLATLTIVPDDTIELEAWTRLVFDVEVRDDEDSTDVATVIKGTLIVTEDVRRGVAEPS